MDPVSILLFLRSNWKLLIGAAVVGGLVIALGVSRLQLTISRNEFAAYKVAAIEAAQKKQKEYDSTTRAADIIYIQAAPQIITQIKTVTKWITHNVENVVNCPGPDVIRVYNASITGDGLPEATAP